MNPRFSQLLLTIVLIAAVLAVMYFSTRPKAPPAEQTPPPTDLPERPGSFIEFDPEKIDLDAPTPDGFEMPGFEMPDFDMPEFEPLPEDQLASFESAWGMIHSHDINALDALLAESPDAAKWSSEGQTLLLLSIHEKNEPAMRALLEAGADVNYSNGIGASPLIDAIAFEWPDAVPILLDAGAGIESPKGEIGQTPLMIAAQFGDVTSMQRLLDAGADIDARNSFMGGETALFSAVSASQPDSVRYLLDAGADAAIVNDISKLNAEQTALEMYNSDLFVDKEMILLVIEAFEAEPDLQPSDD